MTQEQKAKAYDEAISIAKETYNTQPMYRNWLESMFPELAESEEKPNGGIVREDFTQGNGWYKVNLDYLSKAQVEEIEQLVKKWNPKEVSEDEKIKKAILIYLDWLDGKKDYLPKGDYTIKDMILWLEKQGGEKDNLSIDFVLGYLGIKPAYKDGNAWCILLGDNIQEGICGFGDTKEEALIAFMKELIEKQGEPKPFDYENATIVQKDFASKEESHN